MGISDFEHTRVIKQIKEKNQDLFDTTVETNIFKLLDSIEQLIALQKSLYEDGTREIIFLKYCIKNEYTYASKELFSILFSIYKDNQKVLKSLLNISKENHNHDFIITQDSLSFLNKDIAKKMLFIHKEFNFSKLKSDINGIM